MTSVVLSYFHSLILSKHLKKEILAVTGMKGSGRKSHQPNLDAHTVDQSHNPLAGVSKNLITTSLLTDPRNSEARSLSLCFQSQQQTYYFERRFIEQSRQYRETRELCHINNQLCVLSTYTLCRFHKDFCAKLTFLNCPFLR